MSFEFEAPEAEEMGKSGGDGNFLSKPGQYHCAIVDVKEGVGPKGKPIDGFCVTLSILAGTVAGEEGKTTNVMFFNPKLNSPNGGAFARKKQAAFAIASNLIDPAAFGKRVSVELKSAINHQLVAKFESSKNDDGKEYIDLAYSDIWHVDDPRCESVPKNAAALALVPKECRHDRAWFEAWIKSAPAAKSQAATAKAAPAAAAVNFDDL